MSWFVGCCNWYVLVASVIVILFRLWANACSIRFVFVCLVWHLLGVVYVAVDFSSELHFSGTGLAVQVWAGTSFEVFLLIFYELIPLVTSLAGGSVSPGYLVAYDLGGCFVAFFGPFSFRGGNSLCYVFVDLFIFWLVLVLVLVEFQYCLWRFNSTGVIHSTLCAYQFLYNAFGSFKKK